jgi:hypothetical protein
MAAHGRVAKKGTLGSGTPSRYHREPTPGHALHRDHAAMPVGTRRTYIMDSILPRVVPSRQGDARWALLTTTVQTVGTSCALLPRFVAQQLGVHPSNEKDGLLDYGLVTIRNAGIKAGAWRHFTPGNTKRPMPGDFYLLCTGGARHETGCNCVFELPTTAQVAAIRREFNNDAAKVQAALQSRYYSRNKGARIEHVGVIRRPEGDVWTTADSGQGAATAQECRDVHRGWDQASGQLRGELDGVGNRPLRFLCGWLDVDNYPFVNH